MNKPTQLDVNMLHIFRETGNCHLQPFSHFLGIHELDLDKMFWGEVL